MPKPQDGCLRDQLAQLETLHQDSFGANQRRDVRHAIQADAALMQLDPYTSAANRQLVVLRDVSLSGVGLITTLDIATHSHWYLGFMQDNYQISQQPTVIRYSRRINEELFLVGAQFSVEMGLMSLLGVSDAVLDDTLTDSPRSKVA